MKLYKIRKWDELFENSRSRTVKDLAWVCIPNRHDGENFAAIMAHEDGPEIFSAWILVLQVASRCQPRGSLVRDNGTPHNSLSLSVKTRAPKIWFDLAFDFLEKNTDWLDVEGDSFELSGDRQEADGQVTKKERKKEGKNEGKEEAPSSPSRPSGLEYKEELRLRICSWFRRRTTTFWSDKENLKLNHVAKLLTPESDLQILDQWYAEENQYRRRDVETLLNNWNAEIDRAKNHEREKRNQISRPTGNGHYQKLTPSEQRNLEAGESTNCDRVIHGYKIGVIKRPALDSELIRCGIDPSTVPLRDENKTTR